MRIGQRGGDRRSRGAYGGLSMCCDRLWLDGGTVDTQDGGMACQSQLPFYTAKLTLYVSSFLLVRCHS